MMYRVIVIVGGALALAACSSSSTPDWMKPPDWAKPNWNLDAFKPAPMLDTVRFESEPPGAEAKTSNGQSCRTPCALALPVGAPLTVTFSLNGYQPSSERIEPITTLGSPTALQPNPVTAELTPAPPSKPAVKKPPARKTSAAKPAARANPAAATASAPPPMSASPAPQQAPAPWPSTPPPQR
jgi:hypothetical protein